MSYKYERKISASILKNLRALAALKCLDFIFEGEEKMLNHLQMKKIHQHYHGSPDLNVASQARLLLHGSGLYGTLYDEEVIRVNAANTTKFVLKRSLFGDADYERVVAGEYFDYDLLTSSTKDPGGHSATGRYLRDIAIKALGHVKKAVAIAEEWLERNPAPPSGRVWEDLYSHVLSQWEVISPKERVFTGFYAFVILTKYNKGGVDNLACLAMEEEDRIVARRPESQKKPKLERSNRRASTGSTSRQRPADLCVPLQRGMASDVKIRVIEIAQTEDAKLRDSFKTRLEILHQKQDALLQERGQAIDLAKVMCPVYDKEDDAWKYVFDLTTELRECKAKAERAEQERKRTLLNETKNSGIIKDFLSSMCRSPTKKMRVINADRESIVANEVQNITNDIETEGTINDGVTSSKGNPKNSSAINRIEKKGTVPVGRVGDKYTFVERGFQNHVYMKPASFFGGTKFGFLCQGKGDPYWFHSSVEAFWYPEPKYVHKKELKFL
eukprot:CAMPEP_0113326560 /NCGR_PEP_ID=MMETSP0010_2-20120614/18606_1 /TAXON_ID=216773 ORGANISM="Corethron hystrix, Strain 308" /NCGR_SAMPLE_ID=MMETSP0010_2 /ASSEMBLY_ACC=CAM_ASM_000155 /LENGTH=498 /DNA_ID=CAMNT_0000186939 /DNA_START=318 /DNA_END=1817 /DNA_ORIENTATION=+ /assembly_acc=CAM_ASM_000155